MSYSLQDLAVFFDSSEEGLHILEIASRLAAEQNAHLIGITTADHSGDLPASTFARGQAIQEVFQRQQSTLALRLLHAGQSLSKAAARHGIATEFRIIPDANSGSEVILHALHCDLLVVGHPNAPGAPLTWSPTQVLQRTGVPLLIVPANWQVNVIGQRITVAWNASRQARRALADAIPLLVSAKEVQLLLVDPQQHAERHGEEPGADMASYLARHGVKVDLLRVSSRGGTVADAIAAQAISNQSDLIVFGAWSRPRLSEAMVGGVTRTLLAGVPLPLFISH